jgi:hypothetical protein
MNKIHTDIQHGIDHMDAALDAALAESFPASDPVAINFAAAVDQAPKRIARLPWRISAWKSADCAGQKSMNKSAFGVNWKREST